eukprot:TRINITY_DN11044_c0_g1_i1.p1 TRINITY_DN11044_c0_g1~~TRINITY_DN11044_c0_g1_i1.p1  ORF type:complete len:592 (-),score=42.26 TRINITY_DN11044_c0_g1_i1:297-2072(-)
MRFIYILQHVWFSCAQQKNTLPGPLLFGVEPEGCKCSDCYVSLKDEGMTSIRRRRVQTVSLVFSLTKELYAGTLMGRLSELRYLVDVILRHEAVYAAICPVAFHLSQIFLSEEMLVGLLPLASSQTSARILEPWLHRAMTELHDHVNGVYWALKHPVGAPLVLEGMKRVRALNQSIAVARQDPWLAARRSWLHDPFIWWLFRTHIQLTEDPITALISLPVGDMLPMWDGVAGAWSWHRSVQGINEDDVRTAWEDILTGLRTVTDHLPLLEWWPVAGTLIAFLRYGRIHGTLSDGKVDIVDEDIDVLVTLPSAESWFEFCLWLAEFLVSKGWVGCGHGLMERLHDKTSALSAAGADLRGLAIMVCIRVGEGSKSSVSFNAIWVRPVNVLVSHVDSNQDEPCPPIALLGSLSPSCGGRVRVLSETDFVGIDYSSGHHLAALTEEVMCLNDGRCWSISTFFRAFPHKVLAASHRLPPARCEAWGHSVPCPHAAVDVSRFWNAGEYWRPTEGGATKWPCLALPDVACSDGGKKDHYAWRHNRVSSRFWTRRLHEEGFNSHDVRILKAANLRLRRHGFVAHNFSGCNWTRCFRRVT